jgi:hypothetical protein
VASSEAKEPQAPTEKVGLLEDYSFLASKLSVYVLSLDGWSWAVAWAQLGIRCVRCIPLSPSASAQLDELAAVPCMNARLVKSAVPVVDGSINAVTLCAHVTAAQAKAWPREWDALREIMDVWRKTSVQIVTMGGGRDFQVETRKWFGALRAWQQMKHCQLGGLTAAIIFLGWREPKLGTSPAEPGKRRNPVRPLDRFLEPSTKLGEWKRATMAATCWSLCRANATPFPVPWGSSKPWVEAPTSLLAKRGAATGDDRRILI